MGSGNDDEITSDVAEESEDAPELCALVSIEGVVTTHVLPTTGTIDLGRGSICDVVIPHSSVSRRHATLQISPLEITDLDSRNGTVLRGDTLEPGISTSVEIGEALQLGHVTVLIHYKKLVAEGSLGAAVERSSEALRRQLEIECARAARTGSPFAYAQLLVQRGRVPYEELRTTLGMTDAVADAGDRYELMLSEGSPAQVAGTVSRVTQLLERFDADGRFAVARYPYDGTTAEALMARVFEQLESPLPAPVTEMDAVRALIAQVAPADVSILINGETGVGKELCAEMLHRQSPRADCPFVKLNCSTITESLIESELFGHERGAFTGATTATAGLFEAGDGGTVFLDEIGELPLPAQAKLLRVLEERIVRRVGSTVGRTLDVRFVCATNRDLPFEVDAGRFRRDLYYRINGVTITIPPLRERPAEIAGLARAFASRPRGPLTSPAALGPDVIAVLAQHPWPGNIRELRNTMERAVLLAAGGPIRPQHLILHAGPPGRNSVPTMPVERISSSDLTIRRRDSQSVTGEQDRLSTTVAEVERRRILDALDRCGGNQTRAARMLGVSRNTLLARIDAYGLRRPRKT